MAMNKLGYKVARSPFAPSGLAAATASAKAEVDRQTKVGKDAIKTVTKSIKGAVGGGGGSSAPSAPKTTTPRQPSAPKASGPRFGATPARAKAEARARRAASGTTPSPSPAPRSPSTPVSRPRPQATSNPKPAAPRTPRVNKKPDTPKVKRTVDKGTSPNAAVKITDAKGKVVRKSENWGGNPAKKPGSSQGGSFIRKARAAVKTAGSGEAYNRALSRYRRTHPGVSDKDAKTAAAYLAQKGDTRYTGKGPMKGNKQSAH